MKKFVQTCLGLTCGLALSVASPLMAHETKALKSQEHSQFVSSVYKVSYQDTDQNKVVEMLQKAAITFHGNLLESNYEGGYLIMEMESDMFSKLAEFGFTTKYASAWIEQYESTLHQMESEALMQADSAALATGIPRYSCYETVEESFSVAQTLATNNPNIASWNDIGDSWEKTNGLGGYDLQVLKITNSAISGNKPKLFINSAIHAREYTTAPLALNFAKHLIENYGTDADATWIVDHHEVHLLLQANPDGRKKAETGLSWRKNTNQNHCGSTSNSRGVDLNRNFSHYWNFTGGSGSSGNQCDSTYRGPSAASEPEVQTLEAYVRSLFPDNRGPGEEDAAPSTTSGIHLDIHSYSELVLWPYGHRQAAAPNGPALQTLGRKFAYWNGYTPQQSVGLYPTDGTSDSISYGELGVPAYTFELGTSFFQSCNVYNNSIVPDNMPALIYAAKVVRTPYITPGGPDAHDLSLSSSSVPAGTQVTLSGTINDTRYSTKKGTEATQNISAAEYYVEVPPWGSSPTAVAMTASDGSFNTKSESATGVIDTTGWAEGKHLIYVRGRDTSGTWGAISAVFLTIDNNSTPAYCSAQGDNPAEEWIQSVQIGSFIKTSGSSSYSDFTSNVIDFPKGSQSITLKPAFSGSSYNEVWKIWVDLNQDGDFFDVGEEVFNSGAASSANITGTITIPSSALLGETRMRVAMRYNAAPTACGNFNYGEVEDYTINIKADTGGGVCSVNVGFESGSAGWSNSGTSTCSTGAFIAGTPTLVTDTGVTTQPSGAHAGNNAFFSASNTSAGANDVDGGNCVVESPVYSISANSEVSLHYFHGQRDAGDDASGDFFKLEISTNGGASYSDLVSTGDVTSNAAWTKASTTVRSGDQVKLRVQVSDGTAAGDLVEAGIDELAICPL